MKRVAPKCASSRGFTILEILLALTILAIGIVSVMALFPIALNEMKKSIELTRASSLARTGRATLLYLNAAERIIDHPEADDDATFANGSARDNLGLTGPWFFPDDDEVFFPGRDADAICDGEDVVVCGENTQYSWEATIYQKYPSAHYSVNFPETNGVPYLDMQVFNPKDYTLGAETNPNPPPATVPNTLQRYVNSLGPPLRHSYGDVILAHEFKLGDAAPGVLRDHKLAHPLRETLYAFSKRLAILSTPAFTSVPQGIPYRSVTGVSPTFWNFTGDFPDGGNVVTDVNPDPSALVEINDIVVEMSGQVDALPFMWFVTGVGLNQLTLDPVTGVTLYDGTASPPASVDDMPFVVIDDTPPLATYYHTTTGDFSQNDVDVTVVDDTGTPALSPGDYIMRTAPASRWYRIESIANGGTANATLTLTAPFRESSGAGATFSYGSPLGSDDVAFNVQIAVYRGRDILSGPNTISFVVGSRNATYSGADLAADCDIEVGDYIYLDKERWWYQIAEINGTAVTLEQIYTPLPYTPITQVGSDYQAQGQAFSYTKKIITLYNTMIGRE
jgi:prepilin-type N-terminal cleavage/methylation domain-containing protein